MAFAGALAVRGCRNACSLAAMPAVALSSLAVALAAFVAFLAESAARLASKACASGGQVSRTVLMRSALMSVDLPLASICSLSCACSCRTPSQLSHLMKRYLKLCISSMLMHCSEAALCIE